MESVGASSPSFLSHTGYTNIAYWECFDYGPWISTFGTGAGITLRNLIFTAGT